jgi:small subunit ribosomal protein S13
MGIRKPKDSEKPTETKEEKAKEKKVLKKKKVLEGIKGIVRIAEVDVEGDKKIRNALLKVKGIGKSLSKAIVVAAGLDPEALIGSLNDDQIKRLEDVLKNPGNYGIPYHMLNRRYDPATGENKHLVSSELTFTIKSDIDLMRKIRCYKGVRHELGLPVRGQRTRSSFRTEAIVGVSKKKAMRAQARKESPKAEKK